MDIDNCMYRVSAKGIFIQDETLLLSRIEDKWCIPGGGTEYGENIEQSLIREFEEELGIIPMIEGGPSYIWKNTSHHTGGNIMFIGFPISLPHFNFTPSDECEELRMIPFKHLEHHKLTTSAEGFFREIILKNRL